MELAPIVGLADLIVDLVDTGNTLKANGLAPLEHIADVSSQLIVNKASMKMKHARVNAFVRSMAAAVEQRRARAFRAVCYGGGGRDVRHYTFILHRVRLLAALRTPARVGLRLRRGGG